MLDEQSAANTQYGTYNGQSNKNRDIRAESGSKSQTTINFSTNANGYSWNSNGVFQSNQESNGSSSAAIVGGTVASFGLICLVLILALVIVLKGGMYLLICRWSHLI